MQPGQFNKRIKFTQITTVQNEFLGSEPSEVEVLTTFGDLQPVRQYNQWALEAGASVLNGDKTVKIRKRNGFDPKKDMMFYDVSNPANDTPDCFIIKAILPYYPTKTNFENKDNAVYHDNRYIYIVGVKRS